MIFQKLSFVLDLHCRLALLILFFEMKFSYQQLQRMRKIPRLRKSLEAFVQHFWLFLI